MVFKLHFLKICAWMIFGLFGLIVFYFPAIELIGYFAYETRLFDIPRTYPIEDAFLPLLLLTLVYALLTALIRKIEKPESAGDSGSSAE